MHNTLVKGDFSNNMGTVSYRTHHSWHRHKINVICYIKHYRVIASINKQNKSVKDIYNDTIQPGLTCCMHHGIKKRNLLKAFKSNMDLTSLVIFR